MKTFVNEGNLTENAAKVATNVESANRNAEKKSNAKRNPLWGIITKARNTFNAQLVKDNATKLRCIEMFATTMTKDGAKFWSDFMEQVNVLLDSKRYERECEQLGISPEILATHIVFLGAKTRSKVLKEGVRNTIQTDFVLYKDRFVPEEAMQFVLGYVPKQITDGSETVQQEAKVTVPAEPTAA